MSLRGLLPLLRELPSYNDLVAAVRARRHPCLVGPAGSEKAFVLAALADEMGVPDAGAAGAERSRGAVLLITPSQDIAERLHDDLLTFLPHLDGRLLLFPQWD